MRLALIAAIVAPRTCNGAIIGLAVFVDEGEI
jgi:hypothetical protein